MCKVDPGAPRESCRCRRLCVPPSPRSPRCRSLPATSPRSRRRSPSRRTNDAAPATKPATPATSRPSAPPSRRSPPRRCEDGTKGIDYPALVADQWRNIGMDEILDKRVDIAVEEVRSETSWSGLAQSLVSKEKAQALATSVAERVYRSDAVKDAIEALATGVGKEVGRAIEVASQDAAGPALECLRAFLGPRYGSTVAGRRDRGSRARFRPARARRRRRRLVRRGPEELDRRHDGRRHSSGAPSARQHGLPHRPAPCRQRAVAARLGRGRRHRPRTHRQGHLGAAGTAFCRSLPTR